MYSQEGETLVLFLMNRLKDWSRAVVVVVFVVVVCVCVYVFMQALLTL